MRATLINTSPGEYGGKDASRAVSSSRPCRVLYASWHPDEWKLANCWIAEFKDRVELVEYDDFNVPVVTRVNTEPPMAGGTRALTREDVARALADVTDFLVVATARYFRKQRDDFSQSDTSELMWMIDSLGTTDSSNILWIARLEKALSLPSKLGHCQVKDFARWHDVRSTPFEFPGKDDMAEAQRFADQLNEAVALICAHPPESCASCLGNGGRLRTSRDNAENRP